MATHRDIVWRLLHEQPSRNEAKELRDRAARLLSGQVEQAIRRGAQSELRDGIAAGWLRF